MTDHDQLFKQILTTFFADLVEIVEPELAARLQTGDAKFLDKETFSATPEGHRAVADLVAEVPAHAEEPQLILVHVEIEGVFRRTMAERLWFYYMHLRLNYQQPTLPILLTLSGGPAGVTPSEWTDEVLGQEICRFRYQNFGLSGCLAEDYLDRPQRLAWGLAALMKSEIWDRVDQKIRCLQAIARAGVEEPQELLLLNLVETYLELDGPDAERFDTLKEIEAKEARDMETTWAAKLEAKGREQGHSQGREQGLKQGSVRGIRRMIIRQIEHRFGPLPQKIQQRLETLEDPHELDRLSEQLLDARSLADLGLAT